MLYEMVTGRPPFLGDDSVAIIGQHINTPPVAPTWHNGQCPRPLEALIMRLLAKDPSERPESASDVSAALDAIDLDVDVGAGLTPAPTGQEHSLDSLAGGVFVGRQREMGAGAADIAEVVSDVRERLPGLASPPQLEPEQARFRLFDSITSFLKTASQRHPLVLVLDDLH